MAAMKKLADFKNEEGIVVASKILPIIIEILSVEKNLESKNEKNPLIMFSNFMKNSPAEMKRIFAILSQEDENNYNCDGSQALFNMLVLANDPVLVGLFISQGQKGDAKSSGSVSVNTEE